MAICVTTLPAANADACTLNLDYGRIDVVLYTRAETTDAMTDSSDAAEWTDRISNSDALTISGTPAPIRYLYVTGDWPLPERTKIEVSNGRSAFSTPKHTITLDVDDVGATNAALLAAEQATTKRRKVWFIINGKLHGGASGYEMDMTFLGRVIPGARTEKQTIKIQLDYEGVQTASVTSVVPV